MKNLLAAHLVWLSCYRLDPPVPQEQILSLIPSMLSVLGLKGPCYSVGTVCSSYLQLLESLLSKLALLEQNAQRGAERNRKVPNEAERGAE